MSRPLRIEYPGAFYHVFNRGVERRRIFAEPVDFRFFLRRFGDLEPRYGVNLISYCVMPNHYHLFLGTPRGQLHRFMQELNSSYAQHYNKRCRRVGPVFQGRYAAVLVNGESHTLAVARYIHLNPVRAGLVDDPGDYRWSSYRSYLRVDTPCGLVKADWLLSHFGEDASRSRAALHRFTLAGMKDEGAMRLGIGVEPLGDDVFRRWVKREKVPAGRNEDIRGLRSLQKPPGVVKEAMMRRVKEMTGDPRLQRKLLIYGLCYGTSLTGKEVAGLTGVKSRSAVAQTVRRLRRERRKDDKLDELIKRLEGVCRK